MTLPKMRFEQKNICAECGGCADGLRCAPARQALRGYRGLRFTSDGFDCALPVSIDSHSMCAYGCLYCFSDNLVQHRDSRDYPIGQQGLQQLDDLFAGRRELLEPYRKALRYYQRNAGGYPCPVQLGALTDPCDHIERQQGWLLEFIPLAIRHRQPVRMSTKGTVLGLPDYQAALSMAPELFWVAFSIASIDDDLLGAVDRVAPVASARLKTMAALSKLGVSTSLRLRPMIPGLSDSTPKHPNALRELVQRAAAAGARAVSYEVAFMPGHANAPLRWRWDRLQAIVGVPMGDLYSDFGPRAACMRPPYAWTEEVMHTVAEEAHANGMVAGVSDPVWKQLTDVGCCCGIKPDDPVFGNWQTESATNQLLLAKQDASKRIGPVDVTPAWARDVLWDKLVNPGTGPSVRYKRQHWTWADELRELWNDLRRERNPLNYFQGALLPDGRDAQGDVLFRYAGLERQHKPGLYWHMMPPTTGPQYDLSYKEAGQ